MLEWAAFATLGVYVLGSAVEAAGMGLRLIGGASQIDARSVPAGALVLQVCAFRGCELS